MPTRLAGRHRPHLRRRRPTWPSGRCSRRSPARRSVLRDPAPDVIVIDFAASSVNYRVRFWVADYGHDDYGLRPGAQQPLVHAAPPRHRDPLPDPDRVQPRRGGRRGRRRGSAGWPTGWPRSICSPASTTPSGTRLAEACPEHLFGAGERIVRQGDAGRVDVRRARRTRARHARAVGPGSGGHLRGGFFGEMSMLTGDPRTATVSALDDAMLLEITADRFRELALTRGRTGRAGERRGVGPPGGPRIGTGGGRGGAGGRAGPPEPLARIKKYLSL